MKVRWKRHRDGVGGGAAYDDIQTFWTATINGTHVVITNMQGQSVRYSGLGSHVLVWKVDRPDDFLAAGTDDQAVHTDFTVRDAKKWAVERYS